ncbi:hypothetical protein [Streptomyces sp. NBC_00102]|uniref:hypothetical protein n=1 Tax=Streptomyces sp. NBC_00102 TaxID=2975652 RepID=UPI002252B460|nr:hypothetical protein [Streptomyces sp. NBC_00102]MCX5398390.1 hypothetical protein [Streptomyces sp. NBC_00102]
MPQRTHSRRALLTAAVAVPAAVAATPLLAAPAAAATTGGVEVAHDWTALVLAAGVTASADVPAARVIRIAGTAFLQLRGGVDCAFAGDAVLGTVPASLAVPKLVRGVCPRNNKAGMNACRVEISTAGRISVFGGTTTNAITWIALDSFSAVLA